MNLYYIKNGQQHGPYSETEVLNRLQSGAVSRTDLAWREGNTEALPLSQIIAQPNPVNSLPPPQNYSTADLIRIASKQKIIIWLAALWVPLGILPVPTGLLPLETGAFCIVHVLAMLVGCHLAHLLKKNVGLWVLLTLLPLVNLFGIARLVSQAAKLLKENGIGSGLLGADQRALDALSRPTGFQNPS